MGWLGAAPASFQEPVQRMFDQRRPKGNIALADAVELVQAYALFDAYRNFGPIVGALDAEDEQRRYATEDDVLIKARDGVSIAADDSAPQGATEAAADIARVHDVPRLQATPGKARLMVMSE